MNLKKLKWPFYIFTFLLITVVATILQGLKNKTIPQILEAIILVGLFYAIVYGIFRVVNVIIDKKGDKSKRERVGEMVALLIAVFLVGFILGNLYAKHQKTDPTYYECLQLGSDWARKECIDKYDLKTKLPTHEEKINFQEEKGSSTYDRLTR